MKLSNLSLILATCLALVFFIGSVGAHEAGGITTAGLIARCSASSAVTWASLYTLDKRERRAHRGNKHS